MECILREIIQTVNGPFTISEIGEAVFWEVSYADQPSRFFYTLEGAQHYIRDTEFNDNWEELFEEYLEVNLAVS